jgi:hypothetical protein
MHFDRVFSNLIIASANYLSLFKIDGLSANRCKKNSKTSTDIRKEKAFEICVKRLGLSGLWFEMIVLIK